VLHEPKIKALLRGHVQGSPSLLSLNKQKRNALGLLQVELVWPGAQKAQTGAPATLREPWERDRELTTCLG